MRLMALDKEAPRTVHTLPAGPGRKTLPAPPDVAVREHERAATPVHAVLPREGEAARQRETGFNNGRPQGHLAAGARGSFSHGMDAQHGHVGPGQRGDAGEWGGAEMLDVEITDDDLRAEFYKSIVETHASIAKQRHLQRVSDTASHGRAEGAAAAHLAHAVPQVPPRPPPPHPQPQVLSDRAAMSGAPSSDVPGRLCPGGVICAVLEYLRRLV